MAERNVIRFALVAGLVLLVMMPVAQEVPAMLDVPAAYGIVASGAGLAVILFSWHVWVQTSPGGIDLEGYEQRPIADRLVDFVVIIAASAVASVVGAAIGIESGVIEAEEMWGGGTTSWLAATVVVIVGMAVGIYAGVKRNGALRIPRETGRGE